MTTWLRRKVLCRSTVMRSTKVCSSELDREWSRLSSPRSVLAGSSADSTNSVQLHNQRVRRGDTQYEKLRETSSHRLLRPSPTSSDLHARSRIEGGHSENGDEPVAEAEFDADRLAGSV